MLVRRAYLELADGAPAAAREAMERALELRRQMNDRRGIGIALAGLGFVDTVSGELARAERELTDACDLFRRAGDRWGLSSTLWRVADLEIVRGRYDEADAALEEAVAVLGTTRRPRWFAHTMLSRAEVAYERGDLDLAAERFAEARTLYAESKDDLGVAAVDERTDDPVDRALSPRKGLLRTTLPTFEMGGRHECDDLPGARGSDAAGTAGGGEGRGARPG